MPRTMRVEYPGAIDHVMDRADRREDIYLDDVDRQDFLKTLAEAGQKTGWQVHAHCLMRKGLLGWEEHHLACRLKNDPRNLALAARLRKERTLPIKWIAARLQMGMTKSARSMLHHWMQHHEKPPCSQPQFPMV